MFAGFITALRNQGVPVSLTEYLTLIGAMQAGVAQLDVEDFYFLARASLVKDERLVDRFDRVFALYFRGLASVGGDITADIPDDWLKALAEKYLTPEELAAQHGEGLALVDVDFTRSRSRICREPSVRGPTPPPSPRRQSTSIDALISTAPEPRPTSPSRSRRCA